jgi:hypothetical protein
MKTVILLAFCLVFSGHSFASAMSFEGTCVNEKEKITVKLFSDYDGCKEVSNAAIYMEYDAEEVDDLMVFTGKKYFAEDHSTVYSSSFNLDGVDYLGAELTFALNNNTTATLKLPSDEFELENQVYQTMKLTCDIITYSFIPCNEI